VTASKPRLSLAVHLGARASSRLAGGGAVAVLAALPLLPVPLPAQSASVLPTGTCRQLAPREFQLTVTFLNCGAKLGLDYLAFIHFDRARSGERLYNEPAPGPRPLVMPTKSSAWAPDEVTVIEFPPVTFPPSIRKEVFVKVGLWDPQSGVRFPLAGEDVSHRVLVGGLVPEGDGFRFVRYAPGGGEVPEPIGVRPRSLVRPLPSEPLVRFGEVDTQAWRVEPIEGGQATVQRTREELCWSESSLRLTYSGETASSGFVLRPPEPLPVPADADVAHLWLFGRAYGWAERRTREEPLLRHWLDFTDAQGTPRRLSFRQVVGYPFWYVARARIPADWPRPLQWTGAGFVGCTNAQPRTLLLDTLVLAKEQLAPTLTTDVRFDGLPFPTSPDGLLPDAPPPGYVNRLTRDGEAWEFVYEGADETLRYRYLPATGTFGDLEVLRTKPGSETQRFRPAAEGGPILEFGGRTYLPGSRALARQCVSAEAADDVLTTVWRCSLGAESAQYRLTFRLRAKSLLVEIDADAPHVTGVAGGRFSGASDARFVAFPYWSWQVWDYGRDGGVVVAGGAFVSGFPDWYRSRASTLTWGADLSHDIESLLPSSPTYVPSVRYDRRSDGSRNPVRERFIFTVSSQVSEVLPNIPHPPSPNRDKLSACCHDTGGQAARLNEQLEEWRRLAAYGVRDVYIRHFDGMWSDIPQGTQEWTLTEHAAPLVGDVAMRRYLDAVSELGFFPVLYTNYTDLQPVAAEFDWDKIAQLPDGDISDYCWPGSYPIKPLRAVELEAKYAPRIAQRFGTRGSFCDVHTAAAPWHKLDYDARLPGAGEFGTTYRSYAKLLLNERATYGAVYSEGSMHWLYAGLADGSDAQLRAPHPCLEPFLVDFDLRKIHPLEMDAGMSWISRYVDSPEDEAALGGPEAAQDRFTAATIAFGHQGTFTNRVFRGYSTDIKTYYLLTPLQHLYAMRRAEEIRYRNPADGRMLTTTDALLSGAYRESQVYVRYETGLDVWVNGSLRNPWRVEVGGVQYTLPPSGFVCRGPNNTLVYSVQTDAGRVDYASSGDTRFIDTRGNRQTIGPFDTDGAAILRPSGEGTWTLWPLGNVTVLRVRLRDLGVGEKPSVFALDENGQPLPGAGAAVEDGWLNVPTNSGAFSFVIRQQ